MNFRYIGFNSVNLTDFFAIFAFLIQQSEQKNLKFADQKSVGANYL